MDAVGKQTAFVYTTYIQETPERVWHGLTDPALMKRNNDVGAQCRVADIDVASGRVEEAFERLLEVIQRTSGGGQGKCARTPGWPV